MNLQVLVTPNLHAFLSESVHEVKTAIIKQILFANLECLLRLHALLLKVATVPTGRCKPRILGVVCVSEVADNVTCRWKEDELIVITVEVLHPRIVRAGVVTVNL